MTTALRTRSVSHLLTASAGPNDAELLRRYRESGEAEAFEAIVRRHAATVLGACRRVLTDTHAADDAFQATFLQLARKARALSSRSALAAWLYTTARRTALRHRQRRIHLPPADVASAAPSPLDRLTARELVEAIEEEIARLPEVYWLPLVLCYLDGRTKREAAEVLGLMDGVLRGRLDRGREKLRAALIRRGLAPSAVLGLLVPTAGPATAELVRRTVGICARGESTPAAVVLLAAGRTGLVMKSAIVAGLLLIGGLGLIAAPGPSAAPPPKVELAEAARPPRLDQYGDPLPPGAIARMGSIRWRHTDGSHHQSLYVVPSPSGKLVATVSRLATPYTRETVRVWDLSNGRPLCSFPWEGTFRRYAPSSSSPNLQFSSDESRMLVLTHEGTIKSYNPINGKELGESTPVLETGGGDVRHRFTTDGRWVVSSSGPWHGGTDYGSKMTLTEVVADPAVRPRQVRLDPPECRFDFASHELTCDGNVLLSCGFGTTPDTLFVAYILRWNARTGKWIRSIPLSCTLPLQFSLDGKLAAGVAYGSTSNELCVWATDTGAQVLRLPGADPLLNCRFGFSRDGKRLICGFDDDSPVSIWDIEKGKEIARVKVPGWCESFHLLPDGKSFLAASEKGMMFGTWDIATGRRVGGAVGHESRLRHLEYSPDGKTLLTAASGADEPIAVWDAATGKKLRDVASAGRCASKSPCHSLSYQHAGDGHGLEGTDDARET